ncbi:hypothetical protein, partial [uncultured Rubinisphaera sp.]|uniref:hypothetical protein n=1 Tax=uncultured Rubinisphaera sp. TaxID=1678686 RepID=UPI0030D98698
LRDLIYYQRSGSKNAEKHFSQSRGTLMLIRFNSFHCKTCNFKTDALGYEILEGGWGLRFATTPATQKSE